MDKEKEENLEEIYSMAGGSVEGYAEPLGAKRKKEKRYYFSRRR